MNSQFSSLIKNPEYYQEDGTIRFSSAAWFDFVRRTQVLVAGCGGIGSWTAFMLSRLRPGVMHIIDPDTVDRSNMGGQLFASRDIGTAKVRAVNDLCDNFSNYYPNSLQERLGVEHRVPLVCFGCFDNMEARRLLYNLWKDSLARHPEEGGVLIDGRLSAEVFQVFCITNTDYYYMDKYENEWLFSDEEADSEVCSYKQTSYCANMIASIMTNLFVNWCANQCDPLIERSLPFMVEYNAEQMFLKTEV